MRTKATAVWAGLMGLLITGAVITAQASVIAYEKFHRSTADGDYVSVPNFTSFDDPIHNATLIDNLGFSADKLWASHFAGTANVTPRGSILTGTPGIDDAVVGAARAVAGSGFRAAHRELDVTPAGSVFYMSGLVQNETSAGAAKSSVMGLSTGVIDGTGGIYLGINWSAEGAYLAAFLDDTAYNLSPALAGTQLTSANQIVLRWTYGEDPDTDTLTAWYAHNDDTAFTLGTTLTGLDLGAIGDLSHFALQARGGSGGVAGEAFFDEWRFGTTLDSVSTIPEPGTLGLLVIAMGGLLWRRRKRA